MADTPVIAKLNNSLRFQHDDKPTAPAAPAKRVTYDSNDPSYLKPPATARPVFLPSAVRPPVESDNTA